MPLDKVNVFGNPNIGVYIFTNNKFALVPPGLTSNTRRKIGEVLNVEVVEARVAGSPLLGIFLAGNDSCVLAPRIIRDDEMNYLDEVGIPIKRLDSKFTALGNVILTNNSAAMIHPGFSSDEASIIKSSLKVLEARKSLIAGIPTVGSAAVVTDNGAVIHPDADDVDVRDIENFFRVASADIATVNFGVAFIKTGLIANNYGALVGERTTGPEIMRIMKALGMGE